MLTLCDPLGVFYYILISIANLVRRLSCPCCHVSDTCSPIGQRCLLSAVSPDVLSSLGSISLASLRRPRQVISAINIPLSVMLGPVLACRLVSRQIFSVMLCDSVLSSHRIDSRPPSTRLRDCLSLGGYRNCSLHYEINDPARLPLYTTW